MTADATTLDPLTLALAAGAGLLTFVSPCVLPLLPAYLAYITGLSVGELAGEGARTARIRLRVLGRSLAFVVGLALVFTLFGASASAVGNVLLRHQTVFLQVAGALVVVAGLHLAGLLRIPWFDAERRVGFGRARAGYAGAFLMGAAFGAGWTPCIGPFLAGLLALASRERTVWQGMLLLFVYALGLGVPFVAAALATGQAASALHGVRAHLGAVKIVSGGLVVAMGLLIFTDRLSIISGWLTGAFGTGLAG